MLNKYVKRGLIIGMAVLVFLVLAYFLGIKTYSGFQEEASQAYQKDLTVFHTTATVRLSHFESTLKTLQQFGGGDVIFEGGEGFVRFRVSKDGNFVIMVPVFASVPTILSNTRVKPFLADKFKYYTIRLTSWERERLEQMAPFQDATLKKVAYPKDISHIFLEAKLGSDISAAAELTETILTKTFHIRTGQLTIYAGDYHKFRWSTSLSGRGR
jgi:hypothetical protein